MYVQLFWKVENLIMFWKNALMLNIDLNNLTKGIEKEKFYKNLLF